MGFDLYGLNPNFKNKKPSIDWDKKPTKEEQEKFFADYNKWRKKIQDIILEIMFGGGDH